MKKLLAIILSVVMVLSCAIIVSSAQDTSKIDPKLQEVMENKSPDDTVCVSVTTNPNSPNPTEMPSWPDKIAVRNELKEFYANQYNKEIAPVVFDGIEYEEVFVGSGIIVVSVKVADIEKIASHDIVSWVEYYENGIEVNADSDLFEEVYKNLYIGDDYSFSDYYYNEIYYHSDENQQLDWVLVRAYSFPAECMPLTMKIGNRVLYSDEMFLNFKCQYGVYDVAEGNFYDLFYLRNEPEKYDGLLDAISELKIGYPFGDADRDHEITILDATKIQRCLAEIEEFPYNEFYSDFSTQDEGCISDIDRDGCVSIIDATVIQRHLAGIN